MNYRELPTSDLIARLRRAAATWFKNDDLLLVEELIRRLQQAPVPENYCRLID